MGCSLVVLELTHMVLGCVAQSVAYHQNQVASLILALSHTFMEIDHEISSMVIFLTLIQEGLLLVTSKSSGQSSG